MEKIHDRMPVILPPAAYDDWLDPGVTDKERLRELLLQYPSEEMDIYPVSKYVNSAKNNDERCITAL